MTPLRQPFIQDLQLRNRSPKTVAAYVFHVRHFARHFGQSPDQLGGEQVHRYLVHLLHEKKASWPQYNQAVSALRFLVTVICPSDTVVTRLPYGKRPKRLPVVRSRQEVARLLGGVRNPVTAMVLKTIYAAGLRRRARPSAASARPALPSVSSVRPVCCPVIVSCHDPFPAAARPIFRWQRQDRR